MSAKKIKLLLTASEFMYNSQVRNICDVVKGLDRDIFDIEVGALAVGDEATREIESLGVPFYRLVTLPTRSLNFRNHWNFLISPLLLNQKHFDLVHSFLWQSQAFEPLIIKTFSKAKYIYTKSNLAWDNHPLHWHIKSRLADRIISISGATDALLASHGFTEKICKIHHGIDTDYFKESMQLRLQARKRWQIPQDAFVFECAAQFVEWKEHITTLEAFEQLADIHPNVYLLFCGPHHCDDYYQKFLTRYQNSPAKERIRLVGTLSNMPEFYSAIDCFVMVSRFEPFGYAYIEAMSCKRPVIACNAGGPAEIVVPEHTGLFAEMSNSQHLLRQMKRYLENSDLLKQHANAARQRAINIFSREIMARRTQELYLETYTGSLQGGRKRLQIPPPPKLQ